MSLWRPRKDGWNRQGHDARRYGAVQPPGCYKLVLSSHLQRHEAHGFYEGLGFRKHGFSFLITPPDNMPRSNAG